MRRSHAPARPGTALSSQASLATARSVEVHNPDLSSQRSANSLPSAPAQAASPGAAAAQAKARVSLADGSDGEAPKGSFTPASRLAASPSALNAPAAPAATAASSAKKRLTPADGDETESDNDAKSPPGRGTGTIAEAPVTEAPSETKKKKKKKKKSKHDDDGAEGESPKHKHKHKHKHRNDGDKHKDAAVDGAHAAPVELPAALAEIDVTSPSLEPPMAAAAAVDTKPATKREPLATARAPRDKKPRPASPPSLGSGVDGDDKTQTQEDLVRVELTQAGVALNAAAAAADDGGDDDAVKAARLSCQSIGKLAAHMRDLGGRRAAGFCQSFEAFLQADAALRSALMPLKVNEVTCTGGDDAASPCLLRVLLGARPIQTRLAAITLELFFAKCLADDVPDDVPKRLLAQLKMLDHVWDARALAERAFETMRGLSDTNSPWLREVICALPEMLADSEHASAVEHLLQMMRENRDLAAPIIDALTDLSVPASLRNDLIDAVLDVIKTAPVHVIPVAVRFLLRTAGEDQASTSMVNKIIERLAFIGKADADSEALTIKELHHGLLLRPGVAQAYLLAIKEAKAPRTVADVWLLIALRTSPQHAQPAMLALKRMVAKSDEASELLRNAIVGHRVALEQFFTSMLEMAAALVRANVLDKSADALRAFGTNMYRLLFLEFADARCRQEVALNLAIHCGAGPACKEEVDVALRCLRRMVRAEDEARALAPFSSYVRSLLADLERFDKSQARMVFRVVGRLAQSDGDGFDEVKILLRKLLASCEPARQMLGIVGTIQMAAIVAPSSQASAFLDSQPAEDDAAIHNGGGGGGGARAMDLRDALELVDVMMRETRSSAWDVAAFLYDEVAAACESGSLHARVKSTFGDNLARAFEAHLLSDKRVDSVFGSALIPVELFLLDEATSNKAVIQILPLLNEAQMNARALHALNTMCPMVRCMLASNPVEDSDAVLGCALSLPSPAVLDQLATRSLVVREAVCASFFHASNWMREVIGAFARAPADDETRQKILARVGTLVLTESYLARAVASHLAFAPPVATTAFEKPSGNHHHHHHNNNNKAPGAASRATPSAGATAKKKKAAKGDAEEGGEDADGDADKPAAARASVKTVDEATAQAAVKTCLRELSPHVCRVLGFANLALRYASDDDDDAATATAAAASGDKLVLSVAALRLIVESLCDHLAARLTTGKRGAAAGMLYEMDALTLVAMAVDVFPALRVFCDDLAQRAAGKTADALAANETADAVAIIAATAQCVTAVLKHANLRHSRKGEALLLGGLRAFALEPRQLTAVSGLSFSADVPVRTDASALLAQASKLAMAFFVDRVARSGALSASLDVSMTVFILVKELAALHRSVATDENDIKAATADLVKLARSMLRQDWKAPAGLPQPKYGKTNVPVLVQTFLEHSPNVLDVAAAMVDELAHCTGGGAPAPVAEGEAPVRYPSLSVKTLPLFYGQTLASLTKSLEALHAEDVSFLDDVQRAVNAFSAAVLVTQRVDKMALFRDAVKNGRAFLDQFMKKCAPVIVEERHDHAEQAQLVFSRMQTATRQLQALCAHGAQVKDPGILTSTPGLRKLLQAFVFMAVSVFKENSSAQVTTGLLKLRNIDGTKTTS